MKETLTVFLLFFALYLGSCVDDDTCIREVTYIRAQPVFAALEQYRLPIYNTNIDAITNPGKGVSRDNLWYVEDTDLGIHIFSNKGSSPPVHINFIRIPGIRDFFLEDNLLIVNSYYDILSIDIQDPTKAQLIRRNENAFPIPFYNYNGLPVVGFQFNEITEKVDCQSPFYDEEIYFFDAHNELIAPTTIPSFLLRQKTKN